MTMDKVHAKCILNVVTDKELSQQIQVMWGNTRLLVIIDQTVVALRGVGQSDVMLKTNCTHTHRSRPLDQQE